MEPEIHGDTDLETSTILRAKKCGVTKHFVADFFSKSTHWQSDRDQRHFSGFVFKWAILRTSRI